MINKIVLMVSIALASVISILGALLYLYNLISVGILLDLIVFSIAIALIPSGIIDYIYIRRIREIENRIPDFLQDVAEASRFGMTLADAIISTSKGKYGILTNDIKKMAGQLEWGVPVSIALEDFLERTRTPLTERVVGTIIKANEAGGNVSDVLSKVAQYAREVQQLTKEKYSQLGTYNVVLLISFGVFLVTILILNVQFFPEMIKSAGSITGNVASNSIASINVSIIPYVKLIFAAAVLISAVGDGIMAGVLKDGRYESGFIMAAALAISGYIFLLLLGGV